MRLPFRGYVTTNYHPAIDFARMDPRPENQVTSTPTWEDDDELVRWYNGDIFKRADMIIKVKEPQPGECAMLREGQLLYTYLHLAPHPAQTAALL